MKKLLIVIAAVIVAVCSVFVSADELSLPVGEVLYHQNFADVGDFRNSGIRVGSLSSTAAEYGCAGEYFSVNTKDSGRVYMILPEADHGSTYTVEFSVRFTDTSNEGGYIAFMLTCRGDEPTNITSLVIRANGAVDDFGDVPAELMAAIFAGEEILVTIPVENDILSRIIIESGDNAYTLERDSMLMIGDGGMGFMYRYIGAAVREIYIVNGVGYTEKTGTLAENSFATDDSPVVTPNGGEENGGAPVTADAGFTLPLAIMTLSLGAVAVLLAAGPAKRSRG